MTKDLGGIIASRQLPKQAILIVNAMSRSGADMFVEVRDKLTAAGVDLLEAHAIDKPDEMEPTVRKAVAIAPMVIIGGGDGSLSSNVDFFVGHDTVFACIPLGTANSFAGTLGIPKDVDSAVDVIAHGMRRRIDLGRIDDDYFVNAAAIGLSPIIARTVPHKLKRYLGIFGYLLWALWCAFRFRPFKTVIKDEAGVKTQFWATEVRIANGSHHGGVELIESQQIDSGVIVIQAVTGRSVWGLAWSWFATIFKLRSAHGTMREFRGTDMLLDTRPRQHISIDGEVAAKTPVKVSVAGRAIEVAAPRRGQF